jgi:TldD protein
MSAISANCFLRRAALSAISLFALTVLLAPSTHAQQSAATADSSAATEKAIASDPILKAMHEELTRSKSDLKMDNVPAPYYIEYRLFDVEEFDAEAAYGALRQNQRIHSRVVRVVVRVGDYKQDSFYGPGSGMVDLAPLENDPTALRRQLWLATDRAYKMANEALAAKKAVMSQYTGAQQYDDFAHAPVLLSIEPLAKLEFDSAPWIEMIEKSSNLFRGDPKIDYLSSSIRFRAINQYFENTEGTVTRHGSSVYAVHLSGSTQAADGMQLERSPYFVAATAKELPSPQEIEAETQKMIATFKELRDAPVVEEDYRGPVLFSPDAATDLVTSMIGDNALGNRPKPGESARTTGDFASNYKGRVLPTFLSVVDDPSMNTFAGKTLIGAYKVDDEGVRAAKVDVIENGVLQNYLLGRQPIRDFPDSNGHGRAAPGQIPVPSIGNLIVESKDSLAPDALKKKLTDLCAQEGKEFCYRVETLAGLNPRLLYRVYTKDGHEELVRGAIFDELDTRTLRNDLVAAGNDPLVSNRESNVPATVIAPSLLLDELEVKRTDAKNAKIPEYPAPDLTKY